MRVLSIVFKQSWQPGEVPKMSDKGKIMPTKQNTEHIKFFGNSSGKVVSRKQILEI